MAPQIVFGYYHPSGKGSIYGEVDEHGTVLFAVQAMADCPIRGTELFKRMMLAFGEEARAIHGVWRKGSGPSINIDKVNDLTAAGVSLEDAIQHAWTVTRARKLGFTNARVLGVPVGFPGAYTKLDVLIEK